MKISAPNWTVEDDARLRALWAQAEPRLSTAAIGRAMGRSKNSIVGRAHRLMLPARPSPIMERGAYPSLVLKGDRTPRSHGVRPLLARGAEAVARARRIAARAQQDRTGQATGGSAGPRAGGAFLSLGAARHPIPAAGVLRGTGGQPDARGVSSLNLPPPVARPAGALFRPEPRGCRWPMWGNERPTQVFCCAKVEHGAYCAAHGARAYTVRADDPAPMGRTVGWGHAA